MKTVFYYSFLLFATASSYYKNIVLVGSRTNTFIFAKRFSEFYNVPLLEEPCFFFPKKFILLTEQVNLYDDLQHTDIINIQDFPHHDNKDPNYFISWWKQKF